MLEFLFFVLVGVLLPVGVSLLAWRKGFTAGYVVGAGLFVIALVLVFTMNFHLVRGGQVGVAMKGGDATTFTGFKITGLGTKVVVFDRSIPLDLNVELDEVGRPTDRTVTLVPKDGSQVYLDARAVVAIDSQCEEDNPRRCIEREDRDQIAALAVQFRKGGQGELERYITGKLRERANLVAGEYDNADEMINQQRAQFLEAFQSDITGGLSEIGFDPTLLVVEQLVPSGGTQERLNAIQAERANTALAEQQANTAVQAAAKRRTEADAAAYDVTSRAKAEAEGIAARGEAYATNPQAAAVDIAQAYGQQGNAVVVTNGQAEVRPIVTTGGAAPVAGQ
jgi:regulator of protease activity HflC (stomatin/prohibitin superfamily)